MKRCSVALPFSDGRVLLGLKKTGFGAGKLVDVGGKIEVGETPREAAIRELFEETGLRALELRDAGVVMHEFAGRPSWSLWVHVFVVTRWEGEATESDEVTPEWHAVDALPYDRMWADAPHWVPSVLRGETAALHFQFGEDGESLQSVRALKLDS
ncbi:8-oxo-dGTP diphosphatase [Deinococcus yavapaiensis]|uniref:Oxidized purine nucleoside triphosphate hydrolase n=1 Tax=Deinococcus yavapaiensis KR-236 TaxID=694435 RepID=A0A318SL18_9DEIO|nr:8-oxo-dGTP diphosphatase [Deinococcus yavapaiensis]PYE55209.1 8-oxo-dGTP diphosphatase [Deinococcus yavapaiensis KR-236]